MSTHRALTGYFSGCLLVAAAASPALAQDSAPVSAPAARTGVSAAKERQTQQTPPTVALPSTPVAPSVRAAQPAAEVNSGIMQEVAKFAAFDKLLAQGQTSNLPGSYDTVDQDAGGFRTWLYDNDLYVKGQDLASIGYDLAGGKNPKDPQVFDGQKVTLGNSFEARLSWKFTGDGVDIGQFTTSFDFNRVSWTEAGPNYVGIDRLDYYQSFFGRKVEVTAGIGANIVNFIGIFSGGNLLLANGLAATIPIEVGLSGGSAVTPLVNVQLNSGDGFYSKTGVQRSIRPEGAILESETNQGGFRFEQPGSKPLVIQEFGLLRPTSADNPQIWLRAGGIYNTTKYERLDGRGTEENWSLYALADYQIFQPSKQLAFLGLYVGASALFAPDALNVFKQTFEGRVYGVGLIPGRLTDALNLTVDYVPFSRTGIRTFSEEGLVTQHYQLSVGLLYAMHITRGVYFTPTLTYIKHPYFIGNYGSAVNIGTSATVLF